MGRNRNFTNEEFYMISKEWKDICNFLKNSGYDLSKIEIIPDDLEMKEKIKKRRLKLNG